MQLRARLIIITLVLSLIILWPEAGQAATVTVGATQTYTTIEDAVDDIGAWGDGNDVIEVLDDQPYIISGSPIVPEPLDGGSLTIRNAEGASPVIAYTPDFVSDPDLNPVHLMVIVNTGTFVIEGLTFLGPAGLDNSVIAPSSNPLPNPHVRSAILTDATASTHTVNVTIRDCLFTANDGSNQPVLNYGSTAPTDVDESSRPSQGCLVTAIDHGDAQFLGKLDLLVDGCTIAFVHANSDGMAQISFGRLPDEGAAPDAHAHLTIRNTLFINNLYWSLRFNNLTVARNSVTIQESAFLGNGRNGMRIDGEDIEPGGSTAPVLIENTIIAGRKREDGSIVGAVPCVFPNYHDGAVSMRGVTIKQVNNDPVYQQTGGEEGWTTWTFQDMIYLAGDSVYRSQGNLSPEGVTAQNVAVISTMNVFRPFYDTNTVKLAFDALYGGAGPLRADPMIVSEDYAVLDGVIGWDRTTNSLYDVANEEYLGKGTPGRRPLDALAGGADHSAEVPNSVREWTLVN